MTRIRTTAIVLLYGLLPFPITALVIPPNLFPEAVGLAVALIVSSTATEGPQPGAPLPDPGSSNINSNIPVLEVVKVYGKLAGSDCYGKRAPNGASCQIQLKDLKQRLLSSSTTTTTPSEIDIDNIDPASSLRILSKENFQAGMEMMEFRWPLKPFGVDGSPSLAKTAVMNKGAETRVFMEELEARRLYDPRNPAGPLPTSLRPALNQKLQAEGILDQRAIDGAYEALFGERSHLGGGSEYLDYYEFLKLFGPNSITWPR